MLRCLDDIEPVGCENGTIRLNGESADRGRLEVCQNHVWGTVCASGRFYTQDANSICHILGYQPFGKVSLSIHVPCCPENKSHEPDHFITMKKWAGGEREKQSGQSRQDFEIHTGMS